jgi:hypothetical protein
MLKHCPFEHDIGGCPVPCRCRRDLYCLLGIFSVFEKRAYKNKHRSGFSVNTYRDWLVGKAVDAR